MPWMLKGGRKLETMIRSDSDMKEKRRDISSPSEQYKVRMEVSKYVIRNMTRMTDHMSKSIINEITEMMIRNDKMRK